MKNRFGGEYDFVLPFDMYGACIPSYKELPPVPIPSGIQISICVPLYNRAKIIELSLQSILRQNFPKEAYEVIFVDDASTDNTREVIEELCKKYAEYNIKAYFREKTTTYSGVAPFNVAFRESVGWIIMRNQIDIIHIGEMLEATWRHHNHKDKICLYPKVLQMPDHDYRTIEEQQLKYGEYTEIEKIAASRPSPYELPGIKEQIERGMYRGLETIYDKRHFEFSQHEWGASTRKECIMQIHGRDERAIGGDEKIDFEARLTRVGIVFVRDNEIAILHRPGVHPPKREYPVAPPVTDHPDDYIRNKDGNWGMLSEKERNSAIMTKAYDKH